MYKKKIIALEGIVHAGKTTLLNSLAEQKSIGTHCIREYSFYAGGGENFPKFPRDSIDRKNTDLFFLELEKKRFETILPNATVIILDRSLVSILAFDYAVEKFTRGRIKCFNHSLGLFQSKYAELMPDLCIWLKISYKELEKRHMGDNSHYEKILLSEVFNQYLDEFYDNLNKYCPLIKMIKIDANNNQKDVFLQGKAIIKVFTG